MNVTHVKYPAVLRAVAAMPWAIDQAKGQAIIDLLALRAAGGRVPESDVRGIAAANRQPAMKVKGAVAVLPVYGVIAPRMNLMTEMSGGTSMQLLGAQIDAALEDPSIGALVLDFDSPGGTVQGVPELAAKILAGRDRKPIIASVNHLAASAAYWMAAQCSEIAMSPSAEAGSIGVFTVHFDESAALEDAGIKATVLKSGKYKAEGNPYEPLSDDARAYAQDHIDGIYADFVHAVAKGRGTTVGDVRGEYGQGRTLTAKQAVSVGMADRIATLDDVLAQLSDGKKSGRRGANALDTPAVVGPDGQPALPSLAAAAAASAFGGAALAAASGVHLLAPNAAAGGSTGDDAPGDVNDDPDDEDNEDGAAPNGKKKKKAAPGAAPADPQPPDDEQSRATADGAVAGSIPPSPSLPAPKAKENPVPNDTAAPAGAATESKVDQFLALATQHKKQLTDVSAWVASGKSVDQVKAELLEQYSAKATPIVSAVNDRSDGHEFHNVGEQLVCVVQAGKIGGRVDPRLEKVNNRVLATASGMNESVGSEGGYFLQPELLPGVLTPVYEEDPILSRVTHVPIGSATDAVKINIVDETSRVNGQRWGGVQFFMAAEADQGTPKKPKMRQDELALHKAIGLAYLTNELQQDAPASGALLTEAFQTELRFIVADKVWRGTGAGEPQGFMNSGCAVSQAIESGQTLANSNQSIALNTAKMLAHMPAGLLNSMIWLYNQELLPTLVTAVVGTGGSAVPVFLGANGISNRPYDTIFGRPAFASELAEAPGTPGDIVAVVPNQYLFGEKGGPQIALSLHFKFDTDQQALRITYRFGGLPTWRTSVTPYKGALQRTPFVTLAQRA